MNRLESQGTELAVNRFVDNPEEVKVTKWFDDFYYYIRQSFKSKIKEILECLQVFPSLKRLERI